MPTAFFKQVVIMKKKHCFSRIIQVLLLLANSLVSYSQDCKSSVCKEACFEVGIDGGIVYAEGLSHQSVNSASYSFYALEGYGHGAWDGVYEGKKLEELAFDFIVEQQNLILKKNIIDNP